MPSQLLDLGIHQHDAGDFLASVLKNSSKPLTRILERLSGTQLHIKVLADGERALTDAERYRLAADGIARCRWRHGLLVTADGVVAASTALTWLPARLPHDTCRELDKGDEPAGIILGRLPGGMRREDRRSMPTQMLEEVTGQPAATVSNAVLMVMGKAIGIAEETITERFAASLTSRLPLWRVPRPRTGGGC